MRIFHVALRSEWEAARAVGSYDRSTFGASLAEVGFVHCAGDDQWRGVLERFYAGVGEPLVLLTIETDRLDAAVVEEPATPGGTETFPHVYGVIPAAAVVEVRPVALAGARSFRSLLVAEVAVRLGLASTVMVATVLLASALEAALGGPWGLVGAVVGLVLGTGLAVVAYRRWDRRAG